MRANADNPVVKEAAVGEAADDKAPATAEEDIAFLAKWKTQEFPLSLTLTTSESGNTSLAALST
jgi:hypothetical protein